MVVFRDGNEYQILLRHLPNIQDTGFYCCFLSAQNIKTVIHRIDWDRGIMGFFINKLTIKCSR